MSGRRREVNHDIDSMMNDILDALDVIKDQINDGDVILMAAVGAGMTGGTILREWKS